MVERHGSVRYPHTHYKTSKYIVAYLDILGGKNLILNDNDNNFLNTLNMLLEDAKVDAKGFLQEKDIYVKIFSDNILIARKIKEDEDLSWAIKEISNSLSNIQNEFINYGYLVRGSIVLDEFFYNDTFVYGKALVRAVQMEEQEAIYPRIIVSKEVQELSPKCFLQDSDGKYFLNNLFFLQGSGEEAQKITFLDQLHKNRTNEKIKEKILWSINYFNFWLKNYHKIFYDVQKITKQEIEEALK